MMNWFKDWFATIQILCDRTLMKDIKQAEKEISEGNTIKWNPND